MRPVLLKGYTRILGKAQGYEPLPVRDEVVSCSAIDGDVPVMVSEYELSLDEIQEIIEGGRIRLEIQGTAHPPIRLSVIDPVRDLF